MINLKLSKSEIDELSEEVAMDTPSYPYSTHISIEDEHLEALNLSAKVGDIVEIRAKAQVVSVSSREDEHSDGPSSSMGFQITDIEIKRPGKSPMAVLYGDDSE